jgi:hypothetical protein
VNARECSSAPELGAAASIEAEAVEAIANRGGDVHAAVHATLVAKACLEAEAGRSTEAIPTGFARARLCKPICEMS